jgi:hypothetical protein
MKSSADDKAATPPAATTPAKPKGFRGPLGSVDKAAMTITLNDKNHRVISVEGATIMRNGASSTLDNAVVGDFVSGMFAASSTPDKLVAKSVSFHTKKPATAVPPPGAAAKPQ